MRQYAGLTPLTGLTPLIGVDDKGRVKLSRKAAMKDRDQAAAAPQA